MSRRIPPARTVLRDLRHTSTTGAEPSLGVIKPNDGKTATVGNGVMVSLSVDSNDKVDASHKEALALGGTDAGPPGPRDTNGFYAAYFRDLDGHKLNCYCYTQS